MTERMRDERLAELRRWHDEHSHAEMLAEIDRGRAAEEEASSSIDTLRATAALALEQLAASRAAEAELRAEVERARALVNAISDLPGETEERYTYEQCAEYARYLYNDAREAGCDAEEATAERDRLLAVVVAQAEARDALDATAENSRAEDSAEHAWRVAAGLTEALGRELRGKP